MQWVSFELSRRSEFGDLSTKFSDISISRWSASGRTEVFEFFCREPITWQHVAAELRVLERKKRIKIIASSDSHYDKIVVALRRLRSSKKSDVFEILGECAAFALLPIIYERGAEHYRIVALNEKLLPRAFQKLERLGRVSVASRFEIKDIPVEEALLFSDSELFSKITDKQASALLAAIRLGYFRVPRRTKYEDLARLSGMPRTTFETHVRKAEGKVLEAFGPFLEVRFRSRERSSRIFPLGAQDSEGQMTGETIYEKVRKPTRKTPGERMMNEEYFKAIKDGDSAKVEQMVGRNSDLVNAKNESGLSGVVVASYYAQPQIAEFLISKGANLNIFEASMAGREKKIEELVAKDPELVNSYSSDGFTALHLASFFGHAGAVKLLVKHDAEVNSRAKNMIKVMPLHSAAAHNQLEICKFLIENGADVNAKQERDFTPLHASAMSGNLELARLFVTHGAEINARTDDGRTPLDMTRIEGRESGKKEDRDRVAEFLTKHGGKGS